VKRRVFRLGPILLSALAFLPGCELLERYRHPPAQDEAKPDAEEPSETKGFFKSSRIPGAMSSEGREIEQSLGIR
jgi:hypothetical protein